MELREISATNVSPYRCYVRGSSLQSEGPNVHTIGFKDGLAVVQAMTPTTDMQRLRDNVIDNRAIDLTKLKKIIVKVDPTTGKKYILKDGKKIELVPQVSSGPLLAVNSLENRLKIKSITKTPGPTAVEDQIKPNIILKLPQSQGLKTAAATTMPKLTLLNKQTTVKTLDNVKYHVLSVNVKKSTGGAKNVATSTTTDYESSVAFDKNTQTDEPDKKEVCTQTELLCSDGRESPFSEQFFHFILGDSEDITGSLVSRKMIDPNKLKTREEINKFSFFNDMRNALNFDPSGNLPIHDSVMRNQLKAVQKNCIVLKAIRESVNIVNQQGYAPLHLAILHDVNLEIVKVLLHHGANLRVADGEGNTAIHLAIENRRSAMLKILVNGAIETKFNLNVFNYEGFTPLILACLNQSYDDAKLLLLHGADPNVRDMKSGRTALFHAAECHDVDLVELLMQNKADTKLRNFFGTSPHDAMFELDEMPLKIKFCILGREHQRFQSKKKLETKSETPIKKAKLETTPVLRRVSSSDMMINSLRK
jgi:ankyrin repeat protein